MPNKSANQIHTVLISAHFSSISEIYCSQISVVSLSAVCSSFDRVSTFSWASPRNFTCKMLMRWSAHLPKRGVSECVTDTNWFYWLVITLITFFLLVTIFVTMFINVYLPSIILETRRFSVLSASHAHIKDDLGVLSSVYLVIRRILTFAPLVTL